MIFLSYASYLAIASCVLFSTREVNSFRIRTRAGSQNTLILFGKKHLASAGVFLDMFPRSVKLDKRAAKITKNLQVDIENIEQETEILTGDELRSNRNRNLKEVKKELDEIAAKVGPVITRIEPKRKRTEQDILIIVNCLNEVIDKKGTQLTEAERLGVYDPIEFDLVASVKIPEYNEKLAKNTNSWIVYHRRKGDLRMKNGKWVWGEK